MRKSNEKITIFLLPSKVQSIFTVDGQTLSFKKNEKGHLVATFESEKEEVDFNVRTIPSELVEPKWGLYFIIFFFISILNIFNPAYPKKDIYELNYEGKLKISESPVIAFSFNNQSKNMKAIVSRNEKTHLCFDDNQSNIYFVNKRAKIRRILVNLLKALTIIALIICLGALIIWGLVESA